MLSLADQNLKVKPHLTVMRGDLGRTGIPVHYGHDTVQFIVLKSNAKRVKSCKVQFCPSKDQNNLSTFILVIYIQHQACLDVVNHSY